jgi:hypothetical protein
MPNQLIGVESVLLRLLRSNGRESAKMSTFNRFTEGVQSGLI